MNNRHFVGRTTELQKLRALSENLSTSTLTAIYGRRRVGKTRLVHEACKGFKYFLFEGLEGESPKKQKEHFLKTLSRYSGQQSHKLISPTDWEDILIILAEFIGKEPCIVLFDEFQWMAAGRHELVSKLKYVWDNYFKEACHVHLILCGSVSSFIVKKVIRSKALFGRITTTINLQPLKFSDVKNGFFQNRSVLETLECFLITGGIPTYLELFNSNQSVRLNLEHLCFKPGAYFTEEIDRIFTSHFGRVSNYRRIVEFLAENGFSTRDAIVRHLGTSSGGRISEILEDLELAGFIEGYTPLQKTSSRNLKRYRIVDPCLRFYYRFINPMRKRIIANADGVPLHLALPDVAYAAYKGLAFENFCRQHASFIAQKLGFAGISYDYGSFFGKDDTATGAQVDLIFKRTDGVATVCEIKCKKEVGLEVIDEVEKKLPAISKWFKGTTEKVLISAYPPSKSLINQGYFSTIITIEDFLNP